MASTYTTNSGIEKPGTGEQSGSWGNSLNDNFDIIDSAMSGSLTITVSASTHTLTTANGSVGEGQNKSLIFTSSSDVGADTTVTISPNDAEKIYIVKNSLAGSRNLIFSQGSGSNVTIANGKSAIISSDGGGGSASVTNIFNDVELNSLTATTLTSTTLTSNSLTLSTSLPVASGGTGSNSQAGARTSLGLGTAAVLNTGTSANNIVQLDGNAKIPAVDGSQITNIVEAIVVAASDETSNLTTGTAKTTFRMPYAFTLTGVRASVTTAPTGSTLTVDINENGSSILSTKITIDSSEKTSTTAATAPVISDTALADDAEITIDIDQVGSSVAGKGLKVTLLGKKA